MMMKTQKYNQKRLLKAYDTAALYHLFHSLALMSCSMVETPHSRIAGFKKIS